MRLRLLLLGVGGVAAGAAFIAAPGLLADSASHTWSPFVLVAGLLLIGAVADADGVFACAARLLVRSPGGNTVFYAGAMALVAAVTVVLNLDTSVAFLTPVLVRASRLRRTAEGRLLYGTVFLSNAASLLLPGSNLTNLLVLGNEHLTGATFLARTAAPWMASVAVTTVGVALLFRGAPQQRPAEAEPVAHPHPVSLAAVGLAGLLVLLIQDPAVAVLVEAMFLVAVRGGWRRAVGEVDAPALGGVFLIAVALGTLARAWSAPAQLMAGSGAAATAAVAAAASVLVNNLPAAVMLSAKAPPHPVALLIGLNIGPNLAVTGSLSALIWWQSARRCGAAPSALRYSAAGLLLAPLAIAAALMVRGA